MQTGATPHQVRQIAARMREMSKDIEPSAALAAPRKRFEEAVKRLEAGELLTPAELKALDEAIAPLAPLQTRPTPEPPRS